MLTDQLTLGKSNNQSIISRVVIWPSLSLPRLEPSPQSTWNMYSNPTIRPVPTQRTMSLIWLQPLLGSFW
jgi:hypothetical protein